MNVCLRFIRGGMRTSVTDRLISFGGGMGGYKGIGVRVDVIGLVSTL